ncbi:MAG: YcxB family protein [Ruminococcus sp.]|nr:YcxB family protein [Ruminococcus sp.]
MENKIGEIESNISYEEYKLGVKCRNKHGDTCIIIIAIIYILSSIMIKVLNPVFNSWSTLLLIIGTFILMGFIFLARNIKKAYKVLQENKSNINHYIFYDDHIFRDNETSTSKIYYNKISEVFEDGKYIICFTEINKMMIFKKTDCSEPILNKLRDTITEEKRTKQKQHKNKGNIAFILLGLIPIIVTALAAIL